MMSESLTDAEMRSLEELASSDKPWADAVAAYLNAIKEIDGG